VRDRFGQVMEDYPLAVGALGFLAGAVIAASLPSTRIEDEWVGEHRDDLLRQAKDTGEDVWNRAQDLAKNAAGAAAEAARDALSQTAEAVREEAEKQGFTPDALKEQAQHALGSATAGSKPVAASDNGSKSANASGTVPHGGSKPSAADRSSLSAVSSLSSATSSGKGENPPENR
jgi:hypothetical protein